MTTPLFTPTRADPLAGHAGLGRTESPAPNAQAIRAYFAATQDDYFRWSTGHNMHFGYYAPGMNPFDREAMLERMNTVVIDALRIDEVTAPVVADLGCGSGATARALAHRHPKASVTAITIVPEQIALGCRLNREQDVHRRIGYFLTDYCDTGVASGSHDGAMALESFCYGPGADRGEAAREAWRILKPGARLAVVDGFLRGEGPSEGLLGAVYRAWCRGWSLPGLARIDDFTAGLRRAGFVDIEVRDLRWNVAMCAAHVPVVATAHAWRELRRGGLRLPQWRLRHIVASFLSLVLGLAWFRFGYYLVTATKPGTAIRTSPARPPDTSAPSRG